MGNLSFVDTESIPSADNLYDQYWYLLAVLPLALRAKVIVETGLQLGKSTAIFLRALLRLGGGRLYTFEKDPDPMVVERLRTQFPKQDWQLVVGDSTKQTWERGNIDLLYLDSDHSFDSVTGEIKAFGPHLSKKGIILTHDSMPSLEHVSYTNTRPSATFMALDRWAGPEWQVLLFDFPEGMTMLYRR